MPTSSLSALNEEIQICNKCASILCAHPENPPARMAPVRSRPVLSTPTRAQVLLIGQAPGLTEYTSGNPFSGQAGSGIREVFSSCGLGPADFDRRVYQTSAVKCFPGRFLDRGKWKDRQPCADMLQNCASFL